MIAVERRVVRLFLHRPSGLSYGCLNILGDIHMSEVASLSVKKL